MYDRHRRKKKKSQSRSPILDPWQEQEERVTVHIINESDDEVTFLGICKPDEKENVPKPGERIVEKVKKGAVLCRSRPRKDHEQKYDRLSVAMSKGTHSILKSSISVSDMYIYENLQHDGVKCEADTSGSRVVIVKSMPSPVKTKNVDHHVFQICEGVTG